MALRPKDSPRERASDRETERWLACLLLLLSWWCGNRIAACLLRFLTLRWCKPEVRKFCWITRISKLNNFFNFLLVLSCLLLKIQCSSEQLFFFFVFSFFASELFFGLFFPVAGSLQLISTQLRASSTCLWNSFTNFSHLKLSFFFEIQLFQLSLLLLLVNVLQRLLVVTRYLREHARERMKTVPDKLR